MANDQTWDARVAEWKTSGLTALEFCAGRDFAAGTLRYQAQQLKRRQRAKAVASASVPPVRIARVERSEPPMSPVTPSPHAVLTIEVGRARVAVPAGFDAATVRTVLDALVLATTGAAK